MSEAVNPAGRIPTLHIEADSIPRAHFRAIKAVWEKGARIRTEYDKKDSEGQYIDPPSRDARVLIEVTDPFTEPRFPPILHSEIGVYIAEIMGAKDHLVLSMKELLDAIRQGGVPDQQRWPYTYSGRIRRYLTLDAVLAAINGPGHKQEGLEAQVLNALDQRTINQIDLAVERIVATPHSRRAMLTTAIPFIDNFLLEDVPCLREIQLRVMVNEDGCQVLNMNTTWRSRDLYKAWPDNVIGLTFLQRHIAGMIERKSGIETKVGSYADYSCSLHIYGSYFKEIEGDRDKGLKSFFDRHDEDDFVARSMSAEQARDFLVLPEMKDLLTPQKIEEWKFTDQQLTIIRTLVEDLEQGRYLP